jgi:hypothetical protein
LPIYDQTYGELLTAKETCLATGFTMNQLRNWRVASRLEKAPFGYVSIGITPYYRKASVQLWLDRNAGDNIKYTPAGTDKEVPLGVANEKDFEKRNQIGVLSSITTRNYWLKWYQDIASIYNQEWASYVMDNQRRFYAQYKGIEDPSQLKHLNYMKRAENLEQFYYGGVMSARVFYADKQGWDISEEEILAMPVGELPPSKETK